MELRPVGGELYADGYTDGQTDITNLTVTIFNFANAPKWDYSCVLLGCYAAGTGNCNYHYLSRNNPEERSSQQPFFICCSRKNLQPFFFTADFGGKFKFYRFTLNGNSH
jgi:hypothetical protein